MKDIVWWVRHTRFLNITILAGNAVLLLPREARLQRPLMQFWAQRWHQLWVIPPALTLSLLMDWQVPALQNMKASHSL